MFSMSDAETKDLERVGDKASCELCDRTSLLCGASSQLYHGAIQLSFKMKPTCLHLLTLMGISMSGRVVVK